MADAEAVAGFVASCKPIPADLAERVHKRAKKVREDLLEKFGIQNIGVPAIRELRDDLPAS
jgi:DNA-binding NtrC family response regulator